MLPSVVIKELTECSYKVDIDSRILNVAGQVSNNDGVVALLNVAKKDYLDDLVKQLLFADEILLYNSFVGIHINSEDVSVDTRFPSKGEFILGYQMYVFNEQFYALYEKLIAALRKSGEQFNSTLMQVLKYDVKLLRGEILLGKPHPGLRDPKKPHYPWYLNVYKYRSQRANGKYKTNKDFSDDDFDWCSARTKVINDIHLDLKDYFEKKGIVKESYADVKYGFHSLPLATSYSDDILILNNGILIVMPNMNGSYSDMVGFYIMKQGEHSKKDLTDVADEIMKFLDGYQDMMGDNNRYTGLLEEMTYFDKGIFVIGKESINLELIPREKFSNNSSMINSQ